MRTARLEFPENTLGIPVFKIDKYGPSYRKSDVFQSCLKDIIHENFFSRRKSMTTDAEKAIQKTEQVTQEFTQTLDKFFDVEQKFVEQSKKAAGSVKEASERLAQGIARVEKAANLDRLERYVVLLERAAAAMNSLAELEKTGKLEKIANAIK